jgi:hypothetical protein
LVDLWLGENRGLSVQGPQYWIDEGEGANGLYLGGVQPDADGDDLWLAIERRIGRNSPEDRQEAITNPIRGMKSRSKRVSWYHEGRNAKKSSSSERVAEGGGKNFNDLSG